MVTFYIATDNQLKVSKKRPKDWCIYIYMVRTPDKSYKFDEITEKVLETFATVKQVKHKFWTYFRIDREEIEGSLWLSTEGNRFTLDINF